MKLILILSGSFFEDLKLEGPGDFMICISEQGNLKPDGLLQTFKKLVEKATKQRKRNVLFNIGPILSSCARFPLCLR